MRLPELLLLELLLLELELELLLELLLLLELCPRLAALICCRWWN